MIEKNIDIESLKDIFNEYKKNYNPIINDFTKIYVYKVDNEIVAFLLFTIMYDKCEIIDIFVKNDFRRKRIAQKLINEILVDYNIENITLEVSSENKGAIELYKKLGFNKVAVRKKYYDNSDALLMLKEVR